MCNKSFPQLFSHARGVAEGATLSVIWLICLYPPSIQTEISTVIEWIVVAFCTYVHGP